MKNIDRTLRIIFVEPSPIVCEFQFQTEMARAVLKSSDAHEHILEK